jgi:hypothetical protein
MFVIVQIATKVPMAIVLGLVPIAIVGPALVWLGRVEPEPWSARIHALLWGASVATAGMFVELFFAVAVTLRKMRRRDQQRFVQLVPWIAERYAIAEHEVLLFADWDQMLRIRKRLDKPQREYFDGVHAALARLAHLHDQPGDTDPATEHALRRVSLTLGSVLPVDAV